MRDERLLQPVGLGAVHRQARRGDDGGQRIAQIVAEDAGERLVEVDGLLQLGERAKPEHGGGDMVGDGARQLQLLRRELAGARVVHHELPDQASAADERDERERADLLGLEERQVGGHRGVGGDVAAHDRLRVARARRPRRVPLHGRPVRVGEVAPGPKPHDPLRVEQQHRGAVGPQRPGDRVQRGVEDLLHPPALMTVAASL